MINKGNFQNAIKELKNNKAVSFLNEKENKNKGLLSNVVYTLKDNYATTIGTTEASSNLLKNFNPKYNATIVEKLNEAGASMIAKVHMDELGLGGTGQFSNIGTIENPLDKTRMAGGSSSGSVSTFSPNISFAIGSDTGDSVRLPASYVGINGFKPSYGAISRYGLFSFASSLDHVSYFAHNVNDIIEISNVLFGIDEKDATTKDIKKPEVKEIKPKIVGFLSNTSKLEKYQLDEYNKLKDILLKDKIEIKEFKMDESLLESIDIVYQVISFSESSSDNARLTGISYGNGQEGRNWDEIMLNTRSKGFGYMVQRRFTLGAYFLSESHQEDTFLKAQKVRRLITEAFNKVKEQVDVLLFPATTIAPKQTEEKNDNWISSYLIHANLSGTPSLSLKWKTYDNMPFNLSVDGKLYDDKKLLSHSLYLEKLLGGSNE